MRVSLEKLIVALIVVLPLLGALRAVNAAAEPACIASDLFACDGEQAAALDRLLGSATNSELSDLSILALAQDEPHLVAGRAGMVGRAIARNGRRADALSFLANARSWVFFSQDWVANAAGLTVLARYRQSLADPSAKDTLVSKAINWPDRFSVTEKVLFLRELGYGLAQIGEPDAARTEFERARAEANTAPASPIRQADDGIYALTQLLDYVHRIDGLQSYAEALKAEIVGKLSAQIGTRGFWPKSPEDLRQ